MKRIGPALAALALTACASSSHIMVGSARQPTDPAAVRVYIKPPAKYDVIALVRGASVTGWTQQQDTDNAMASLKKEAARLGANGVLLGAVAEGADSSAAIGVSSSGQTTVYSSGYASKAEMSAQAIFVTQD